MVPSSRFKCSVFVRVCAMESSLRGVYVADSMGSCSGRCWLNFSGGVCGSNVRRISSRAGGSYLLVRLRVFVSSVLRVASFGTVLGTSERHVRLGRSFAELSVGVVSAHSVLRLHGLMEFIASTRRLVANSRCWSCGSGWRWWWCIARLQFTTTMGRA